jgi:hypothetical protein
MKFRTSPDFGVVRAHDGGHSAAQLRYWAATTGDRVILQPDVDGLEDELRAEVVQTQGEILRVRALHDLYLDATTLVVRRGAEFLISRAHIHAVGALAGVLMLPRVMHP